MFKKYTIGVLFLLVTLTGNGQTYLPGGVPVYKIWLQGNSSEIETINFNPVVTTADDSEQFGNTFSDLNLKAACIFAVFKQQDGEREQFIWGIRNSEGAFNTIMSSKRLADFNRKQFINFSNTRPLKPQLSTYFRSGEQDDYEESVHQLELLNTNYEDVVPFDGFSGELAELIVFERMLSPLQREKIESYLSIKYGIPFHPNANHKYLSSQNINLWDPSDNEEYRFRTTAIGRDDFSGLNQPKSKNTQDQKSVLIAYENHAKVSIPDSSSILDQAFLFWSDNNESLAPHLDDDLDLKVLARRWQVVPSGVPQEWRTMLEYDVSNLIVQPHEQVWLVQFSDNENANKTQFHAPIKVADGLVSYQDVIWDADESGSDLFSFGLGPLMICELDLKHADCSASEFGSIGLTVKGGIAPYQIFMTDVESQNTICDVIVDEMHDIESIESGIFDLIVRDANGLIYKRRIRIKNLSLIHI